MVAYTLPAYCQAIEVKPLQVFEQREPRSGENETRTYFAGDEDTLLTSTVAGSVPYRPWAARQTYEARVAEYAIGLYFGDGTKRVTPISKIDLIASSLKARPSHTAG
jgi:hypothetical protein